MVVDLESGGPTWTAQLRPGVPERERYGPLCFPEMVLRELIMWVAERSRGAGSGRLRMVPALFRGTLEWRDSGVPYAAAERNGIIVQRPVSIRVPVSVPLCGKKFTEIFSVSRGGCSVAH